MGLPADIENATQFDFDPRTLVESNPLRASPLTMDTSLPSRGNGSNPRYLSLERGAYQRSKGPSSQAEEEEDYGHLPS
jgi:hypothetical protein